MVSTQDTIMLNTHMTMKRQSQKSQKLRKLPLRKKKPNQKWNRITSRIVAIKKTPLFLRTGEFFIYS